MPSVPNTFAPPGIEPGPFGTLTDDATYLAIQPPPPFHLYRSSHSRVQTHSMDHYVKTFYSIQHEVRFSFIIVARYIAIDSEDL